LTLVLLASLPGAGRTAYAASGSIHLSRTSAGPGDRITVSGSGFAPLVAILVAGNFNVQGVQKRVAVAAATNGSGAFAAAISIPAGTGPGAYPVVAKGPRGQSAAQSLKVLRLIHVAGGSTQPKVGIIAGHDFLVTGSGFTPGSAVTLSVVFPLYTGGSRTATKIVTADQNGNFGEVVMQVAPRARSGEVILNVVGQKKGTKATVPIVVVHRAFLYLNPKTVQAGSQVTVSGTGFVPASNVSIAIVIARTGAAQLTLSKAAQADANGSFKTSFNLPANTAGGTYSVSAIDQLGNVRVTKRLTVQNRNLAVAVSPSTVRPGNTVTIHGTGYQPGAGIAISIPVTLSNLARSTLTTGATANTQGDFAVALKVPGNVAVGTYTVSATSKASGRTATSHLSVSINPQIGVQPGTARPGQTVTVRGEGFGAGAAIVVNASFPLYGGGTQATPTHSTTDASGNFSAALVIPRGAASAVVTITATGPDAQRHTSISVQAVSPTVAVSPPSAIPGASVTVRGSGYLAGSRVDITLPVNLQNRSTTSLTVSAVTDTRGQFSVALHIPGTVAGGAYTLTAKGLQSGRAPRTRVIIARLAPSVVAVPTAAVPGAQVTVKGFGFASSAVVTLSFQGQQLGKATANASGQFSVNIRVPSATATGMYSLKATSASGRVASIGLRVSRTVSTHSYFASLYTGRGYREHLAFLNPTPIRAQVTITYQPTTGAPRTKSLAVNPHSRFTEDVNADVGYRVSTAAAVASDVPLIAERIVYHGTDGAVVPGVIRPATSWYFANGNTGNHYREYIALQNPGTGPVQVAVHILPTHHRAFTIYRTLAPASRTTIKVNSYLRKDAVGVTVTSNGPIVANRTIFIRHGMTSKTGVTAPGRTWYFAAGPHNPRARHWIGVINPLNRRSYITLHAYGPLGNELGTIKHWVKAHGRVGYLMNHAAHRADVAVVLTASRPVVAEQTTYVGRAHNAATDTFGKQAPARSWSFAAVNTLAANQAVDKLDFFNPSLTPVPVVVQFIQANGAVAERTYVVAPLAHHLVDVGSVVPNAQLGLVVASSAPFVALNRTVFNNGQGAMTSAGVHS